MGTRRRRKVRLVVFFCVAVSGVAILALGLLWRVQTSEPKGPERSANPSESSAGDENSSTSVGWDGYSHPSVPEEFTASSKSGDGPHSSSAENSPSSAPELFTSAPSDADASSGQQSVSSSVAGASEGEFSSFYYYEPDRAERYAGYQAKNPELSSGEVVWRVNAGLDGRPYENYEAARDTGTLWYVVNKYRKLPDSFEPDDLVDLGGYRAVAPAAAAYYKMQADARAQGYFFSAISAYRSIESQRNLYNGYLKKDPQSVVDTYSARPGFSEHHTGRAIDLAGSSGGLTNFVNTPECAWVHSNAHKYGFILRYPDGYEHITGYEYEPWHITYVGPDIAADMREKGILTLEEYTVKYIEHTQ